MAVARVCRSWRGDQASIPARLQARWTAIQKLGRLSFMSVLSTCEVVDGCENFVKTMGRNSIDEHEGRFHRVIEGEIASRTPSNPCDTRAILASTCEKARFVSPPSPLNIEGKCKPSPKPFSSVNLLYEPTVGLGYNLRFARICGLF